MLSIQISEAKDIEMLEQLFSKRSQAIDRVDAQKAVNNPRKGGQLLGGRSQRVIALLKGRFLYADFKRRDAIKFVGEEMNDLKPAQIDGILRGALRRHELEYRIGRYRFIDKKRVEDAEGNESVTDSTQVQSKAAPERAAIANQRGNKRRLTLEHPLLYYNFVKKILKLNPDFDVQRIDRSLEVEECLRDLKKKDPHLVIEEAKEYDWKQDYREFLESKGITSKAAQRIAIAELEENPISEEELQKVTDALLELRSLPNQALATTATQVIQH